MSVQSLAALSATAATSSAVIRRYRPADREAVRRICCLTAFRNRGAASVFADTDLFADYFSRYYTDIEPRSAWVAEQDGGVIGYLLGCLDTRRYVRIMARRIVPSVLGRLLWRTARLRYRRDARSLAFLRWLLVKSWREAPALAGEADAAHYHCNVLPEGYGQRLYTRMAREFLDHLDAHGVASVGGRFFERRRGPGPHRLIAAYLREHPAVPSAMAERPTDFGRDVLGTDADLVNRVVLFRVADVRPMLGWLAERYRV